MPAQTELRRTWPALRLLCRSWDGWWEHVQRTLYAELRQKRQDAEEAAAEKARLHAQLRAAARVRSCQTRGETETACAPFDSMRCCNGRNGSVAVDWVEKWLSKS